MINRRTIYSYKGVGFISRTYCKNNGNHSGSIFKEKFRCDKQRNHIFLQRGRFYKQSIL